MVKRRRHCPLPVVIRPGLLRDRGRCASIRWSPSTKELEAPTTRRIFPAAMGFRNSYYLRVALMSPSKSEHDGAVLSLGVGDRHPSTCGAPMPIAEVLATETCGARLAAPSSGA